MARRRRRGPDLSKEVYLGMLAFQELTDSLRAYDVNAGNKYMGRIIYNMRQARGKDKVALKRLKEAGIRAIANFWRKLK